MTRVAKTDNRLQKPDQTYTRRQISPLGGDQDPWQGDVMKYGPEKIGKDADADYYGNFKKFDRTEPSSRAPNRKK